MTDFAMVILWNSLSASALGVLIFVMQRHRWLKSRPGLAFWLWLVVLIKLVSPPLVWIPLLHSAQPTANFATIDVHEEAGPGADFMVPEDLVPTSNASSLEWSSSFLLLSLAASGTAIFLGLYCIQSRRISRFVRLAEPAPAWTRELAAQAASRMGMHRSIPVLSVRARVSPFLWVSREGPHVVLPSALVGSMDREKLTLVIRHELMHYYRRDHWTNFFSSFVVALQWWNPIAWWARRELRFAQELCCDAGVLASDHVARKNYAETLFQTVDFVASQEAAIPVPATAFSSCSTFKRRIEMIGQKDLFGSVPGWTRILVVPLGALLLVTSPTFADEDRADEIARLRGQVRELQSTVEDLKSIVHEFAEKRNADRIRDIRAEEREKQALQEAWLTRERLMELAKSVRMNERQTEALLDLGAKVDGNPRQFEKLIFNDDLNELQRHVLDQLMDRREELKEEQSKLYEDKGPRETATISHEGLAVMAKRARLNEREMKALIRFAESVDWNARNFERWKMVDDLNDMQREALAKLTHHLDEFAEERAKEEKLAKNRMNRERWMLLAEIAGLNDKSRRVLFGLVEEVNGDVKKLQSLLHSDDLNESQSKVLKKVEDHLERHFFRDGE